MKVLMLEVFQGTGMPTLLNQNEYDVDGELARWLIDNRKAVAVEVAFAAEVETETPTEATDEAQVATKKKPRGRK